MGREFLQSRKHWQAELRGLLDQQATTDQLGATLARLLLQRSNLLDDETRQKYKHNIQLLTELYLDLDQSLSSYQRRQLIKNLHSYADDFRELAATG